ncbi:MAG: 5-formyltetrahydrofolate cyclo-ligase [Colwellia sp.]|nr:5-formyltetrahydrofolate cyclo-ligase [Colwellia sp.]MCW8865392.1 5-formyltetrahydrofolate cyclo-ligase [Colwellia sp.]MCW9082972.1 5-formyltetrahydrofolate cyclo-ligase [Colwellia sp.]
MDKRVALRQSIRAKRQQLSRTEQINASNLLTQRLVSHNKIHSATKIALYLANDGELELMLFIKWCWQQGKQVYLPVLHPFCSGHLLFLLFEENSTMIDNHYGISEPKLDVSKVCPLKQLDIIFTPLVAFDSTGARLGMGGGFYDRTLANWQAQHNLYPIGLAHDCQQVKKIPNQSWDIPLPEIITPNQRIICN